VRVVTGAHLDDIVCVKYCAELGLICTASVSGELAIWDYEYSRLLDFLLGHTAEITTINFMYPYALMVTTSMDGMVCIWKVREVGESNLYLKMKCIYRFMNMSYSPSKKRMQPTPIYSGSVKMGQMPGF